jgi:alpha,alpha-trehalase
MKMESGQIAAAGLAQRDTSTAELFGPLLAAVQERNLFADGKTFVDATPLRPAAEIMAAFALIPAGEAALRAFISKNFELPKATTAIEPAAAGIPLREHIRAIWSELERSPVQAPAQASALDIAHPHVVPGGRFREIYYWDSFFTMLGLLRDGRRDLARGMVDAMTDLIEQYGYVPNGTRTYYLGRSQPPLYHLMVALLDDAEPLLAARRLNAMKSEHAWWMDGANTLDAGESTARVARLADGSLVNRYWDPKCTPRDESWREDGATASESDRPVGQVYRDLRAGAESGWDFSSRWLDSSHLASIRTTSIAPIDLNAFMFGIETAIAERGDADDAQKYGKLASDRRATIDRHFWNADCGYFSDFDLAVGKRRPHSSAAALTPLLVGLATQAQADATAKYVGSHFLAPGGLRTTLVTTGEQWDMPNGWAPLQWIAVTGLRLYGHGDLADEIARRWVATVDRTYRRSGLLYEKYDVEACTFGAGGEYAPQTGFGWTNGVTADFLDSLALEH